MRKINLQNRDGLFPASLKGMMVAQGNTLLINGKENQEIDVHAGQTERWRFINSSSARYFLLYLGGKEFKIIGTDGGLLEHPRTVTEILITPGREN